MITSVITLLGKKGPEPRHRLEEVQSYSFSPYLQVMDICEFRNIKQAVNQPLQLSSWAFPSPQQTSSRFQQILHKNSHASKNATQFALLQKGPTCLGIILKLTKNTPHRSRGRAAHFSDVCLPETRVQVCRQLDWLEQRQICFIRWLKNSAKGLLD